MLFAHFLPSLFEPDALRGGTAVVIDVLRASTTICHALDAGARGVIPCGDVEQARATAAALSGESPILGGERDGTLIDGFDLDNSPLRYTPDVVAGRTVVFTTTNGTRALLRCAAAERILIGAFVNLAAVVSQLRGCGQPVHLVCAGTRGEISAEDVLCAGAIARELAPPTGTIVDDQARLSAALFDAQRGRLNEALAESLGGRNCLALGFAADVSRAAEIDRFDVVPVFSPETGRITAATRQVPTER